MGIASSGAPQGRGSHAVGVAVKRFLPRRRRASSQLPTDLVTAIGICLRSRNRSGTMDARGPIAYRKNERSRVSDTRVWSILQEKGVWTMVAEKVYAQPQRGHVSLGGPLRALLFFVPLVACGLALFLAMRPMTETKAIAAVVTLVVIAIVWGIAVSGVRVAAQWERGVVLRLGKFLTIRGPGILYIIPFIDNIRFVDLRLLTLNIPSQQVITKDNVPAAIDGVLFYLVSDPEKAVIEIQDYAFAIAQYAQATLRDVVGGLSLDELLSEREQIQRQIAEIVEQRISNWGLHMDSIRLQDIEMPEDLKRIMSRQASAEREKRATITKAEGDKIAAVNLAGAAAIMEQTPGAMKLRTLQTIDGLGAGPSNTVIMFPIELTETVKKLVESLPQKKGDTSER